MTLHIISFFKKDDGVSYHRYSMIGTDCTVNVLSQSVN